MGLNTAVHETGNTPSSTIIVDFSDSRRGRDALALARRLGDVIGARLVTVTSYLRDRHGMRPVGGWHWAMPEPTQAAAELAESLVSDAPAAISRVVGAASPAHALHETAKRERAELIVTSQDASGRPGGVADGISADAQQVVDGAPCAVAVSPAGFAESEVILAHVGVAFDGSPEARVALASAAGVADALGGVLRAISVIEPPSAAHPLFAFTGYQRRLEELHEQRRADLTEEIATLELTPHTQLVVIPGDPAAVLAQQSNELGLLVMGSRGGGPLHRLLLGSVSRAVLTRSECPVMIVPRSVERSLGATNLAA